MTLAVLHRDETGSRFVGSVVTEWSHPLDPEVVRRAVRTALAEDRAALDVTTLAVVPPDQQGEGAFLVKQDGVLCGLELVREVFAQLSVELVLNVLVPDGSAVEHGHVVATVCGPLAPMLSGERVALNFLQRLSGVATLTHAFVERAAEGGPAQITDTRKTTPGLRALERYAVRVGGGRNHRDSLADGVMIKDNHLTAAAVRGESLHDLVCAARLRAPHTQRIELEVSDAAAALLAFSEGVDVILLDNMLVDELRQVVESNGAHVILEASGGVTLGNVREVAATGVQLISVGALTHSAPALDISFELEAYSEGLA